MSACMFYCLINSCTHNNWYTCKNCSYHLFIHFGSLLSKSQFWGFKCNYLKKCTLKHVCDNLKKYLAAKGLNECLFLTLNCLRCLVGFHTRTLYFFFKWYLTFFIWLSTELNFFDSKLLQKFSLVFEPVFEMHLRGLRLIICTMQRYN